MKTLEDKAADARVQPLPRRRKLPYWEAPRTRQQSLARIRDITAEWVKVTEFTAYKVGKEFIWLKNKLPHGDFSAAVAQTPYSQRTVQRLMKHARECDEVERLLPPSKKRQRRHRVAFGTARSSRQVRIRHQATAA
jgi:hypothetical protein